METTVKNYYDFNMPREEAKLDTELWNSGGQTSVTLQPSGDTALFVQSIKFIVTKDFAMTSGDTITVTINAYDNSSAQTLTLTSGGSIPVDLMTLISWGDAELYKDIDVDGTVKAHSVTIKFKPSIYLRSSTSVVDSVEISYSGTGITAGSMQITTESWLISDEDNSGIYGN